MPRTHLLAAKQKQNSSHGDHSTGQKEVRRSSVPLASIIRVHPPGCAAQSTGTVRRDAAAPPQRSADVRAFTSSVRERDIARQLDTLRIFTQESRAEAQAALRAVRRAARAGDAGYDPARHAALCRLVADRGPLGEKSRPKTKTGARHRMKAAAGRP